MNKTTDGFYKVEESGGTYVSGTFYNPETGEERHSCLRDYDYADCSRDNDDLYYMPIDEDVRRVWLHSKGIILEGDIAEVVKGRTLEHGFCGTVKSIKDYKDRYGRWVATYLYFEEGGKINIDNCVLKEAR